MRRVVTTQLSPLSSPFGKRCLSLVTIKPVAEDGPLPYTNDTIREMIRVDLAGEMAAVRICEAQKWWVSPLAESRAVIDEILEEEFYHRDTMVTLCDKYDATPTMADPAFKAGAFVMGVGTASLGKEAIMCCHAAVEETITEHYNAQLRDLETLKLETEDAAIEKVAKERTNADPAAEAAASVESALNTAAVNETVDELSSIIAKFRDDEQHHQELGEQNGADKAPFYPVLYPAIQWACKFGIGVAAKW